MKNDIKLVLLVGLLIVSLAWGTGSVLSVPSKYVHNLDTNEYFFTIKDAVDDTDTLSGHTIKLEAGYQGSLESLPLIITKGVIIDGSDVDVKFSEHFFASASGSHSSTAIVEAGGVYLLDSGNTFQHLGVADISSTTNASASSTTASATADSRVSGIYFNGSNDNIFQDIVIENVTGTANAAASSVFSFARADSRAYGIDLDESNYNTFQYIDLEAITSTANAQAASDSESEATAYSAAYGISVDESAENNFQYIGIAGISSTVEAGAGGPGIANARAVSRAYGLDIDDSIENTLQFIDINNISSNANANALDLIGSKSARADSRSYGLNLSESNYNTFQYIDIKNVSSNATTLAFSLYGGTLFNEVNSAAYGIYLDESDDNTFQYIGIAGISSTANFNAHYANAQGFYLLDSADNLIQYSSITDTGVGILIEGSSTGTKINYSSLSDNTIYGVQNNNPNYDMDATLNWWGDDSGPAHPTNPEGIGDSVSDNVIYSPWLAHSLTSVIYSPWFADPLTVGTFVDTDPDTPGVQLPENVHIIVDDVGPAPTTEDGYEGYLNQAIWGANDLPGEDTIIVNHGTYTANQPITEGVEIVSVLGSPANTFLKGGLKINSPNVTIGKRVNDYVSSGFTVNGNITVGGGVDASGVHINWNNIFGTVTNNGDGLLDATFNWWGSTNPDDSTVGPVDFNPYLPARVGTVLSYMKNNDITSPQAAIAGMVCGAGSSSQQAVCELSGMGLNPDQGGELLTQFGLSRVSNAIKNGTSTSKFMELLGGYSLPAGGAAGLTNNLVAGGAGSVGGKTIGAVFAIGETVEVSFALSDFEGNPAVDINPTVSLVLLDEEGKLDDLVDVTSAIYDDSSSSYVATFDSFGLVPGYYLVQVDLPDISSLSQVIQVEGEEA